VRCETARAEGTKKNGRGAQPQADGVRAGVRRSGEPANPHYGRDVEQDQIAQAEFAREGGFAGRHEVILIVACEAMRFPHLLNQFPTLVCYSRLPAFCGGPRLLPAVQMGLQ